MKKKWLYAGIAIVLLAIVCGAGVLLKQSMSAGDKTITIVVVDRTQNPETEVLNKSYQSNAETLTKFLEETDELDAAIEESTYGSLLTSIAGLDQDMDNGPWLVFESSNNASCKEYGGMCPAMDDVALEDGDNFTFALISSFS